MAMCVRISMDMTNNNVRLDLSVQFYIRLYNVSNSVYCCYNSIRLWVVDGAQQVRCPRSFHRMGILLLCSCCLNAFAV